MEYIVKILSMKFITHDVIRFVIERPENFNFKPGKSTNLSINKPGWIDEKRPFTFTSLPEDLVLEFLIKIYNDHNGVTDQLSKLVPGDELIIEDPWGSIEYNRPGIFIAGGAGITPFLAIFRYLKKNNRLSGNIFIYSNKSWKDIICERELVNMFNSNLILTLTQEKRPGYLDEYINKDFLKKHIKDLNKEFYLCGPPQMVESIMLFLEELGFNVNNIVF
jgi:ferredoxin-NADP reductase